jgi:hypothetical protein
MANLRRPIDALPTTREYSKRVLHGDGLGLWLRIERSETSAQTSKPFHGNAGEHHSRIGSPGWLHLEPPLRGSLRGKLPGSKCLSGSSPEWSR